VPPGRVKSRRSQAGQFSALLDNTDWAHGDFNYDGSVNFSDIGLVAQNLNATEINTPLGNLPVAFQAQWNLAVAEV
jgi:hypothetical protein